MKRIFVLALTLSLVSFYGCGEKKSDKKEEKVTIQQKKEEPKAATTSKADLIAQGEKLFKDKTCFTCHMPKEAGIGPSIVDINKIYAENNYDIVKFLQGELEPIVDKDPGQIAVMKANIDGFVKDLNNNELQALKAYMLSIK